MDQLTSTIENLWPSLVTNGLGIAASALVLLFAIRLYVRSRRLRAPRLKGPPSTSLWFGRTEELFKATDLGPIYQSWERAYGLVYRLPASLRSSQIVLGDPKAIAHVFSKDTSTYQQLALGRELSRKTFGATLLAVEGETHKRERRALSSAFSISAIRSLVPVFLGSAYKLKAAWDASLSSQSNSTGAVLVDVQKWMNYVAIDSMGIGGFSHDFGALDGHQSPVVSALDSFGGIKPSFSVMATFLIGPLFPKFFGNFRTSRTKIFRELATNVRAMAKDLLQKTGDARDNSIIATLVRSEKASSNVHMSQEEIMAQINLLMIAGYETTATSLTWALIELSRKPDQQDKLRAELRARFEAGQDLTYDAISHDLPHLDAFTCELLRLHPAAPELLRTVTEDDTIPLTNPIQTASGTVLDSLFVEKGTTIRIPVVGVNMSETLWGPDAATFDPDRWLSSGDSGEGGRTNKGKDEVQGYRHLVTFGYGPRMCLGRNFALTEFKTVLSVLVRNYSFELPGGPSTKLDTHRSVVVRPKVAGEEGPRVPLFIRKII